MPRRDLLDSVESLGSRTYAGTVYRHTAHEYPALSGAGAAAVGGRWNPVGVSTLYFASPRDACIAEFRRMAASQARGAESFLPRDLHVVAVSELHVLDLTKPAARRSLALTLEDIRSPDRSRCQAIDDAAQVLGLQGVLAPSATGAGVVLAAFERNLRRGQIIVVESLELGAHLN